MMRCRICGAQHSLAEARCPECGLHPEASVGRCVPAHIPMPGYLTFAELSDMASALDCQEPEPADPVPPPREPLTAFAVAMGAVKWLGIIVTCLGLTLFLAVFVKACM